MLTVTARPPQTPSRYPPIVLIHGAANSARVWTHWQAALADAGFPTFALDLRGHGDSAAMDLSATSMVDYADDVLTFMHVLDDPPILIGWSMGGLVAMIAANGVDSPYRPENCEGHRVRAVVGLAPSVPGQHENKAVALRKGEFGAEEYGITSRDPGDQPAMPDLDREERTVALASLARESRHARDERARGIVIESLACPVLIVTGTADDQWPAERYADLHLSVERLVAADASHWGLVLNRRAVSSLAPQVVEWILRQQP